MVETVKEPTARASKRREQRRSLIIAAAEDELLESGVAGTTLAAVAMWGASIGMALGGAYVQTNNGVDAQLRQTLGPILGYGSIVPGLIGVLMIGPVGALIMTTLRSGSQMMGWPNYFQEIIIGTVIVLAVALDRLRRTQK